METSASFEARSAPLPYPTANQRPYGSVRGVRGDPHPYRECAEHVRQLEGESPFDNLMEVKS